MTQHLVTTIVPGFTGDVGTVRFTDGVALIDDETDAATLAYCRSAGYTVEDPKAAAEPEPEQPDAAEQPRKSASTEAWRTWAVEHGGMEADEAATLSRDQLVERFTTSTEGDQP
jgi:hypothetical protein